MKNLRSVIGKVHGGNWKETFDAKTIGRNPETTRC